MPSRRLAEVLVDSAPLWVAQTNTWVLAPDRGGPAVVVDAPPDPEGVARLLARHDLVPVALLLTHGHIDHMGGAADVAEPGGIATYVHPDDDYLTLDPVSQFRMLFGAPPVDAYRPPVNRRPLADADVLDLGGLSIRVLHTPGHTPGHCCFSLVDEGVLLSGDQLFAGSIGRTDLPGGDFPTLMASMRRVMQLPDETRVLPGHGPETSIRRERLTNPFRQEWT